MILVGILALQSRATGAVSLQQHAGLNAGTVTSASIGFDSSNTAGNWIAVVVRGGAAGQMFTVTDSAGNSYHEAIRFDVTTDAPIGNTLGIYYAENVVGGPNTVTITQTNTATLRVAIFEYSGIATINSLERTVAAQGVSGSPTSGSLVTTTSGDLLLGALSTAGVATAAAGAGYAIQEQVPSAPDSKLFIADGIQLGAGGASASVSLADPDGWGMVLAAFRPANATTPQVSDLTISKTHSGTFIQGQSGAAFTITVTNGGTGASSGTVTVSDALPTGLIATGLTGAGWSCTLSSLSCVRSDQLGAGGSYPPVTLTVEVASDAPPSVTNVASVVGGGDANSENNTASDPTTIQPADGSGGPNDVTLPSVPGTLSAVAVSATQADLSWGVATDNVGVTGYRLYRCQGAGCSNFQFQASVTGTSYSDPSLSPSTSYGYGVRAMDAAGNAGPFSNTASVTTPGTTTGLVAAYSFEEGAGTSVSDSSGSANHGVIVNATWTTSGRYGRALSFNGRDALVRINDAQSLHLTNGMTLEAWVNPTAVNVTWSDVIYKADDNYFIEATSPYGGPAAGLIAGSSHALIYGSGALSANTWTHLATTYDGSYVRLYVNGIEVASAAQSGSLATSTSPVEIGGDSFYGQFFGGLIDEVRIYKVALTEAQIKADMGSTTSGAFPALSVNTNTVDFANQVTGASTNPRTVTVTNPGGAILTVSNIGISGPNSADFSQNNTCVAPIQPSGGCTINIVFTPGGSGARSASMTIESNAPDSPRVIALTGVGVSGFAVTPGTAVLTPTRTQQFVATGVASVTWSVDGVDGGTTQSGTITPAGLYTAPIAEGVHVVTATATDSSLSATATVYVTSYSGTFTHHNDSSRTGQNLLETVLTPAKVNATTFGKLFSYSIDGMSIASPLYMRNVNIPGVGSRNVVFVATEHDTVYAFDADGSSGEPLWQRSFIGGGVTTVPAADTGECCDISPEVGITGTPVIDPASGTLYVVAKTKEHGTHVQRLHALDVTTGVEKLGGPVTVQASVPGEGAGSVDGVVPFDPLRQNQRPALLLANGIVYIGFGSHGDNQPYHGWLLGYDATTLQQVLTFSVSPQGEGGGIWQANGGPAVDAAGHIYFVTGDGSFDANSGGTSYGDSFIKLDPSGIVRDYFTPHDQANIDLSDFDLGAAGPLLLPDQPGAHPHLVISAGKNATIYLVDRDNMGHYHSGNDNQIVQSLPDIFQRATPPTPGNYSAPVYYNGTVYFAPVADSIQSFKLSNGLLPTAPTSLTAVTFGYPGASMAISANGGTDGILWAVQRNGDCGVEPACATAAPGVLRAYDPANLGIEYYNSDEAGTRDTLDYATKFSIPLVANGRVFVASMSKLTVYGLRP